MSIPGPTACLQGLPAHTIALSRGTLSIVPELLITAHYLPQESTQLGILSFISFGACLALLIPGTELLTKLVLINAYLMKKDNIYCQ